MTDGARPGPRIFLGLFAITLATVMYEILLTRIFSVTMWYHFAFMAISIAMFGMTVGALLVYLSPGRFSRGGVESHLAATAALFSVSIVLSFLAHLATPARPEMSLAALPAMVLTYGVLSLPFVFSGMCVCLALTRFPESLGALYAADLSGAAVGCFALIFALELTDGPTAVIAVAAFAGAGATLFASGGRLTSATTHSSRRAIGGAHTSGPTRSSGEQITSRGMLLSSSSGTRKLFTFSLATTLLFTAFTASHTFLVWKQAPLLRLTWVKGSWSEAPLYEKWNSFSRIAVSGDPDSPHAPFGWGFSAARPSHVHVRELFMTIDSTAGTVLTRYEGNPGEVEYLKYDITNFAHHLRRNARVLVMGPGGGRDVLSAIAFGQTSVLGVEINGAIIDTVNRRFGDFTGHLDRDPTVRFVNDEARSYVMRLPDRFDIIQVSLIDTWAATAAGAFVLTENSLYTLEAWRIFLEHLNPDGILTFSRWYDRQRPSEIYRLASLASASLMQSGVRDPAAHMVILRSMGGGGVSKVSEGVGTLLVSPGVFSPQDLDAISRTADAMRFEIMQSPRASRDATLERLASGRRLKEFTSAFPIDISPPTDDSPFFFNMLRLRDIFTAGAAVRGSGTVNMAAVSVLGALLVTVAVLTLACILVPLFLSAERASLAGKGSFLVFFAGIGFGFMLIEVSQMQRLIVFLGHPTYGLSVVLFTLLLSSGLGSYGTSWLKHAHSPLRGAWLLFLLVGALALFGFLTPVVIHVFRGSATPLRVLVAAGTLFPLGILMGTAFPLGMRAAAGAAPSLTPWFFGINGATSVCASVLAVVIALAAGISAAYWTGAAFYVLATLAFIRHPLGDRLAEPTLPSLPLPRRELDPAKGDPAPAHGTPAPELPELGHQGVRQKHVALAAAPWRSRGGS